MRHMLPMLLLCTLIGSAAAQPVDPLPANLPSTPESVVLVDLLSDYQADRRAVSSFYGMSFDTHALDRLEALHTEAAERLAATDFAALDQQGKIDFLLFRTKLESQAAGLVLARARLEEMRPLIPFAETIAALERDRVAMRPIDFAKVAATLDLLDDEIKAIRARIDKGRKDDNTDQQAEDDDRLIVSPVLAQRTAGTLREMARTLNSWFGYSDGYKPEFGWWVSAPFADAHKALSDYADYLRKTVAGIEGKDDDPLLGDPIGREKLLADLRAEWIPYTPEELIAIAEREFAWCEAEMRNAAREMDLGDDWQAALEQVKQDHAPPGEQDELVASLARESIDFLTERDMVTIPPLAAELWRLEMIKPRNQRTHPFAFYGGNYMGIAYPTDEMSHGDKLMSMRGNNRHFTRAIVHHELIPGHHLQGFIAKRERPYRRAFSTPFLFEGWCLYWEMVLYDAGFAHSPEDRIGMLFWRMHRCARIIVSLKFHLGEMSPDEMVEFLVERVGHERSNATAEVRRYIGSSYSPLYQAAYMLGGLQLRELRRELVETGTMTERAFHDAVLSHNAIPVELIRASLTGSELTPETQTSWRFGE
ncbi:X-Pro dipeptidyl-peptidase [hydrothermal vent metagenome]|uniref:X-Pro dipeptidyl-peptidase n=1 Tax=hydrothermal vent metagenome TaxID=652676 RepID=A0A3B1E890_9ZZZZ